MRQYPYLTHYPVYDVVLSQNAYPPQSPARYAYPQISGVDGGECEKIFYFGVWPSDVDTFKQRLNTIAESMDIGIKTCQGLPQSERQSWEIFIKEWRAFMAEETPTFGAYGKWTNACTYAATIDSWREKLLRYCHLPGPDKIEPPNTTNLVKWAVVGALGIAAVTTLVVYAPEIKRLFR